MLAHKLSPQALLSPLKAQARSVSSFSRPLIERPLKQTHSSISFNSRFLVKRRYFAAIEKNSNRPSKSKTPHTMLAVATTAAVLVGGSTMYSTSPISSETASPSPPSQPSTHILESAAYQIPHPEKKHKGGEDTFMVSSNGLVVGVFDGTSLLFFKLSSAHL